MADAPAIDVVELGFRYPGRRSDALQGVSFSVDGAEWVGLLGPNGGGKTTLLRLLLGQLGLLAIQCRPDVSATIRPVTHRAMIGIQALSLFEIFSRGNGRQSQQRCYPEDSCEDMLGVIR